MDLALWLHVQDKTIEEFAEKIGKDPSLVYKYIHYGVIPSPEVMKEIFIATCGAVRSDDFNGISDKLFDSFRKEKLEKDSYSKN